MYKNGFRFENCRDSSNFPSVGWCKGLGLEIEWHYGSYDFRRGCLPEDVLFVLKERLEFLQSSDFNCVEYMELLSHIDSCLSILCERDLLRNKRGVYGEDKI